MTDLVEIATQALAKSRGGSVIFQTDRNDARAVVDAVLAAIRESIGEDVVEAAVRHIMGNRRDVHLQLAPCRSTVVSDFQVRAVLEAAAPILTLAARDAALEEVEKEVLDMIADAQAEDPAVSGNAVDWLDRVLDDVRALKGGQAHGRD